MRTPINYCQIEQIEDTHQLRRYQIEDTHQLRRRFCTNGREINPGNLWVSLIKGAARIMMRADG